MPVAGLTAHRRRTLLWVLPLVVVPAVVFLEVATVLDTSWMLCSFAKYQVRRNYGTYPPLLDKTFYWLCLLTLICGWFGLPLYTYHFILCNLFEAWQSHAPDSKVVRNVRKWKVSKDRKELRHGERVEPEDTDADAQTVREWFRSKIVPAELADCEVRYKVTQFVSCHSNESLNSQHWEYLLQVVGRSTDGQVVVVRVFRLAVMLRNPPSGPVLRGAITCFDEGRLVDEKWPGQMEFPGKKTVYNTELWVWRLATREYTANQVCGMLMAGMKQAQEPGEGKWEKFPKPGSSSWNCGSYSLKVMIAVLREALRGTPESVMPAPWWMMLAILVASGRLFPNRGNGWGRDGLAVYLFGLQCLLLLPFPVGDFWATLAVDADRLRKENFQGWLNVLRLVDSALVLYVTFCNYRLMCMMLVIYIVKFALQYARSAVRPAVGRVVGLFRKGKRCKLPGFCNLTFFLLILVVYIGTLQLAAMGERVVGLVNTAFVKTDVDRSGSDGGRRMFLVFDGV